MSGALTRNVLALNLVLFDFVMIKLDLIYFLILIFAQF